MRIGHVTFPNPFFMAPMAGVTDSIVRILARRYQCGMVTSEMVSSWVLAEIGAKATLGRLFFRPIEKPIAIQLMGSDGDVLAEAARKVEATGADIVDINLGCSVPKIAKSGSGAIFCRRPAEVGNALEKVVKAVSIPVTVKIRKGWNDSSLTAFEILRVAEEAGVQAIAIHARTSEQAYSGTADWPFIKALKERARIPVIGNGDIDSAASAMRMLSETGCDAVMIGRACRGNPWIFRECVHLWQTGQEAPPPTLEEKLRLILEHLELVHQREGEGAPLVQMRKFLSWYVKGLPNSAHFREKVFRMEHIDELSEAVAEYFEVTLAADRVA
ncbi:MAG: tRNA dihydrouridine synthase DusB [Proteobacteria bacterium]|nr:tRNA dihydrouridine synthase DusB [Pseudomonadota bacterium]